MPLVGGSMLRNWHITILLLGCAGVAFATLDNDITPNGGINMIRPCGYHTDLTYQVTTATGSSAQSTANPGGKASWRVLCTTNAYFAQGTSPSAASTDPQIVANLPEWIVLRAGDKLAFRAVASAGNCDVTECR